MENGCNNLIYSIANNTPLNDEDIKSCSFLLEVLKQGLDRLPSVKDKVQDLLTKLASVSCDDIKNFVDSNEFQPSDFVDLEALSSDVNNSIQNLPSVLDFLKKRIDSYNCMIKNINEKYNTSIPLIDYSSLKCDECPEPEPCPECPSEICPCGGDFKKCPLRKKCPLYRMYRRNVKRTNMLYMIILLLLLIVLVLCGKCKRM